MTTQRAEAGVGPLLREWRERRRLTQLELALDAGISARHLSFVETGRSKPGREMLLRITAQLGVPFRERNQLLLTAGHAPAFPERPLDHPELAPVRAALDLVLTGHEPYPAVVVDRAWNLVASNSAVAKLTEGVDVDPALLEPPVNVVRVSLHPRGLAPLIVNLAGWRAYFRERLERQVAITGDDHLAALIEEVARYPAPASGHEPVAEQPPGVLRLHFHDGRELSFFGMFATFDIPFEVTTSELAIELLFPADEATAKALTSGSGQR
jgi:transcriptional regulator with XRE-family HTH domain